MGIIIFVSLFILALLYPKSKHVTFMISIFMVLIYGLNTYSGDYVAYESLYTHGSLQTLLTHYEPVFSGLMAISRIAGFNFTQFRVLLSIIFVILLYFGIRFYTTNIAIAMGLFMFFPFPIFLSVLRAGLASVIILFSSRYLCEFPGKSRFKYILGVIIATLSHYSSFIFLFALLAGRRFSKRTIACIFLGSFIIGYLINYTSVFNRVFSMLFTREKSLVWTTIESSRNNLNATGITTIIIVIVVGFLVLRRVRRVFHTYEERYNQIELWEADFAYNMFYLSILILPFIVINPTWLRLIWEIQVFSILAYSNIDNYMNESKTIGRFSILQLLCITWNVLLLFYTNLTYIGTDNSVWLIFKNNLLFH